MKYLLLALMLVTTSLQAQINTEEKALAATLQDGMYAVFETTKGNIICKLDYEKVPLTVANFVGLVEGTRNNRLRPTGQPFYDGNTFHRVLPNFMIQGGAVLNGDGEDIGYKFRDEIDQTLRHNRSGILSMANAGPATNNTQFFITHVPTPWLDNKHSVFGSVIAGQYVVDSIAQGDTMLKVRIIRVGKTAKKFDAEKQFKKLQAQQRSVYWYVVVRFNQGSNRLSACTRHVCALFGIVAGAYSLNGHPPPLLASRKRSHTSYRYYPGCGFSLNLQKRKSFRNCREISRSQSERSDETEMKIKTLCFPVLARSSRSCPY